MFLRFKLLHRDLSVALFAEGLGRRSFHDRIAILTNQHTKSAAEMVADFAKTHRLATIFGTRTAGRVLGRSTSTLAMSIACVHQLGAG
jgi:C-terminal processing protease CtpA/Prc